MDINNEVDVIEDSNNEVDVLEKQKQKQTNESVVKNLVNNILDNNPKIVEGFNNGETKSIDETFLILKERIDFEITDEEIRNIIGEEILIR
ncbi:hypothetical protein [uncultured Clostridium sp.]|uniref:hypothetical protein n=1 Tax=uncultured Clostridium sp. TaxID=59620 RepID=UPI00261780D6|nr:hypothetical protein [uncultured Clostridium sp.]